MATSKWCSTCHATYRGSFSVHAGTVKHRAKLRGPARRGTRGELDRALGYAQHHVRRALAGPSSAEDAGMERVRKHRRRRPLDGPRFTVQVRRYWRQQAFGWFSRINSAGALVRERARLR